MSSAEAKPFLVHIGYHKTATTWLQNSVFLPEHGYFPALSHEDIFTQFIDPHGLDFDAESVRNFVDQSVATSPDNCAVNIASLEALSGLPYNGGRESDDYARRLHAVAPEAKILITIREQFSIMASVYMQHIRRGGTMSLKTFFDETPFVGYTKFTAQNYHYDRLVGLYQNLFGAENVLVMPQEMLRVSQQDTVRFLARFAGNTALEQAEWPDVKSRGDSDPQLAVPIQRRINYLRREALNPNPIFDLGVVSDFLYRGSGYVLRRAPLPKRRPVTDYVRQRYTGQFAQSNQRLNEMLAYPVDLSAYEGIGA